MRLLIFNHLALAVALASIGTGVAADDLDAALEAQKEKASRRVYSKRALLEERNLTVPRAESEEERLLDKKLKEMDAALDARPAPSVLNQTPRPVAVVPRPQEDKNWLSAAILDASANVSLTNDAEAEWLSQELDRRKGLKGQASLDKEKALVEKLLREKTEIQNRSPEIDRLKKYQLPLPGILGGNKDDPVPAYRTPQSGTPDPLAAVRWTPQKDKVVAPALFSPEAARLSSSVQNPLRSSSLPSLNPTPGVPVRKSSSVFSYDRDKPKPVPLTPIEMIRKASPINRPNPFAEDHMPTFNTSIWD